MSSIYQVLDGPVMLTSTGTTPLQAKYDIIRNQISSVNVKDFLLKYYDIPLYRTLKFFAKHGITINVNYDVLPYIQYVTGSIDIWRSGVYDFDTSVILQIVNTPLMTQELFNIVVDYYGERDDTLTLSSLRTIASNKGWEFEIMYDVQEDTVAKNIIISLPVRDAQQLSTVSWRYCRLLKDPEVLQQLAVNNHLPYRNTLKGLIEEQNRIDSAFADDIVNYVHIHGPGTTITALENIEHIIPNRGKLFDDIISMFDNTTIYTSEEYQDLVVGVADLLATESIANHNQIECVEHILSSAYILIGNEYDDHCISLMLSLTMFAQYQWFIQLIVNYQALHSITVLEPIYDELLRVSFWERMNTTYSTRLLLDISYHVQPDYISMLLDAPQCYDEIVILADTDNVTDISFRGLVGIAYYYRRRRHHPNNVNIIQHIERVFQ